MRIALVFVVTAGCAFDAGAPVEPELPATVDVATALAWDDEASDLAAPPVPEWLRDAHVERRAASIPASADIVVHGDRTFARVGPLRVFYDDYSGETTEATLTGDDVPRTARLVVGSWSGDPIEHEPIVIEGRDAWLLSEWNDEVYHLRAEPALTRSASTDLDALDATIFTRRLQTCPTSFETCVVFGPHDAVLAAIDPATPDHPWVIDPVMPPALVADRDLTEDVIVTGDARVSVRGAWFEDGLGPSLLRVTFHHPSGDVHVADVRSQMGLETLVISSVTRVEDAYLVTVWLGDESAFVIARYDAETAEPLDETRTFEARIYEDWIAEVGCGVPVAQPVPVLESGAARGVALWVDDGAIWFDATGRSTTVRTPYDGEYPSPDELPPFFELGVDLIEGEPTWPVEEER